jgi:hypothetical protein
MPGLGMDTLRNRLFDPGKSGSLAGRARARRWDKFLTSFPDFAEMSVLDLGGTPGYWTSAPARPAHVRCVNLDPLLTSTVPWVDYVVADACVRQPGRYDIVVSNSLIEHVGGHERRLRFAEVVDAASDRHWVQTPYRYFPIEPHWLFPGFQFLPTALARKVSERWKLGHTRSDPETSWSDVVWVELLSMTDMRGYFPRSSVWSETWGGIPKSLVAIKY